MMRLFRDIRLLPVVLFAAICLFVLKTFGIVADGGYTLGDSRDFIAAPRKALEKEQKQSWAKEMFNYPGGAGNSAGVVPAEKIALAAAKLDSADITGSVGESKPKKEGEQAAKKPAANAPVNPPKDPGGTVINMDPNRPASPAERAILERLQERRQEIEAHAREIEVRDGLVKAAEKRLEARLAELKALEARLNTSMQNREDADAKRFKALVTMYENMKPKDAAKIFDRLDLEILVQVTTQIDPRQMSEILGQMSPEAAERLTVELARRAMPGDKTPIAADLPKIQGKPGG